MVHVVHPTVGNTTPSALREDENGWTTPNRWDRDRRVHFMHQNPGVEYTEFIEKMWAGYTNPIGPPGR